MPGLSAVPQLSQKLLAPSLDVDADLLVLRDTALRADKNGEKDADAAAKAGVDAFTFGTPGKVQVTRKNVSRIC